MKSLQKFAIDFLIRFRPFVLITDEKNMTHLYLKRGKDRWQKVPIKKKYRETLENSGKQLKIGPLSTRTVEMPKKATPREVDQIMGFEAIQNIPIPINEVVWTYEKDQSGKWGVEQYTIKYWKILEKD